MRRPKDLRRRSHGALPLHGRRTIYVQSGTSLPERASLCISFTPHLEGLLTLLQRILSFFSNIRQLYLQFRPACSSRLSYTLTRGGLGRTRGAHLGVRAYVEVSARSTHVPSILRTDSTSQTARDRYTILSASGYIPSPFSSSLPALTE